MLAVAAGHMLHRMAGMALPTPAEHCLEKEGQPGARLGGKVQPRGPPAAQRGLQEKEMPPPAPRLVGLQWDASRQGYGQAGQQQWAAEGLQGWEYLHRQRARREACVCWPLRHQLIVA